MAPCHSWYWYFCNSVPQNVCLHGLRWHPPLDRTQGWRWIPHKSIDFIPCHIHHWYVFISQLIRLARITTFYQPTKCMAQTLIARGCSASAVKKARYESANRSKNHVLRKALPNRFTEWLRKQVCPTPDLSDPGKSRSF